jgi:hypothetical protein
VDDLIIPSWMEQEAPGAAEAARLIWRENLSEAQRQRLCRLTSDTRLAWRETRRKHRSKNLLPDDVLWNAHLHLLSTAFSAAEFSPIGEAEVAGRRAALAEIGAQLTKATSNFRKIAGDAQLSDLWRLYRMKEGTDPLTAVLSDDPHSIAAVLERVCDFFNRASIAYRPGGPAPPVGKPGDREALKTTVIRAITRECQSWFGTPMHSTVATLANASLNRADIVRDTVRGSLRSARGSDRD